MIFQKLLHLLLYRSVTKYNSEQVRKIIRKYSYDTVPDTDNTVERGTLKFKHYQEWFITYRQRKFKLIMIESSLDRGIDNFYLTFKFIEYVKGKEITLVSWIERGDNKLELIIPCGISYRLLQKIIRKEVENGFGY